MGLHKIYSIAENLWSEGQEPLPAIPIWDPNAADDAERRTTTCTLNGEVYVFTETQAAKFSAESNSWIQLKRPPTNLKKSIAIVTRSTEIDLVQNLVDDNDL